MAKQVIALSTTPNGSSVILQVAFWYPVSSGIAPKPTVSSQWTGASAAENTAIQNGTAIEEVEVFSFPLNATATTIKDVLNKRWTVRNGELNGQGPNIYYGIFFDSASGWSV